MEIHSQGHKKILKRSGHLFTSQAHFPVSNLKQPVWELLASVKHAGSHCEKQRAHSYLLSRNWAAQRSIWRSWQRCRFFPKTDQFNNKINRVSALFLLQRRNQDDLHDPVFTKSIWSTSAHAFNRMCCRSTSNKYTCQEDAQWGRFWHKHPQTASGHELQLQSLRYFLWSLKKATKVGTVHSNLQNCMFSLATLSHLVHKAHLQS